MSTRGKAKVRSTRGKKEEKYYPLEPHKEKYFPIDQGFTNFNNVQYYGDSISKYDKRLTNLSDENIIVNLNQYNPISNTRSIPMTYNETRDAPLLPYKADSYALCVSNVYIPSTSIYLFEWQDVVTYINGITLPKYSISVEVNNITGVANGIYTWPLEFFPYVLNDATSGIKRVFEIKQCIASLNKAFVDMWNAAIVDGGLNISPANYNNICYPPTFQLDVESSLIYIVVDQRMNPPTRINANPPPDTVGNESFNNPLSISWLPDSSWIRIGLNYWVSQWFQSSFPCTIVSQDPTDDVACWLNIYNDFSPARFTTYPYGVVNGAIPSAYNPEIKLANNNEIIFYQIYQFNSTTELFSDVEKVVVVSNLQVRPSNSRITGFDSIKNITPTSMQNINILLDFGYTVSSFNNKESTSPIEYTTPWHMWQDILTQDQLVNLSYQVYVQRTSGILTPLELLPGEMSSVKLMFRLK